ncbi:MAG: MFS transporter [Acidimicrobiia bacterium]
MRGWTISFIVAVPVMALSMISILASARSGRRPLLVFGAVLALACTIILPLGIGRRYPRRGGGGPSPSWADAAAITGGALSSAALLILVAVAVHRMRHRING